MIEAGPEDRRRAPVVLGGAEHDDRVGGGHPGRLVDVAPLPDPVRGVGQDGHRSQETHERDRGERPPDRHPAGGAHRPWHFLYLRPDPQ